ncbi:hypothetical protein ES708_16524 [subsurface metagenome]
MSKKFFHTPSDPSKIKFEIARKYFWAWAKIIAPRSRGNIAYIDLFSGKGYYDDGSKATPILILEAALRDDLIKKKLITIFNDAKPEHTLKEIGGKYFLTFKFKDAKYGTKTTPSSDKRRKNTIAKNVVITFPK